ncbi:hypothetical protein VE02_08863 [Pseudogymnoascus sp. 03VT05]|nr:hypothetical protein VE02_08863 [Pseudogymnoascus sp. 03VT05]
MAARMYMGMKLQRQLVTPMCMNVHAAILRELQLVTPTCIGQYSESFEPSFC